MINYSTDYICTLWSIAVDGLLGWWKGCRRMCGRAAAETAGAAAASITILSSHHPYPSQSRHLHTHTHSLSLLRLHPPGLPATTTTTPACTHVPGFLFSSSSSSSSIPFFSRFCSLSYPSYPPSLSFNARILLLPHPSSAAFRVLTIHHHLTHAAYGFFVPPHLIILFFVISSLSRPSWPFYLLLRIFACAQHRHARLTHRFRARRGPQLHHPIKS